MNKFTFVAILFYIFKVSASGKQIREEKSFKSPTSVYPLIFPVLFLYTKLPCTLILSKTTLNFSHDLSGCQDLYLLVFALEHGRIW